MSANGHDSSHEEAHTGPTKNPRQLLLASLDAFVLPVIIIIAGMAATVPPPVM